MSLFNLTNSLFLSARIRSALATIPADADTLHLEYCFDACHNATFRNDNPWTSTAHSPFCCAAILFSRQGLTKMRELLTTIRTSVDDHIPESCERHELNCYKLRRPVYAQDFYWGSSVSPSSYATKGNLSHWSNQHELYKDVPLCRERIHDFDSNWNLNHQFLADGMSIRHWSSFQTPELMHRQTRHPEHLLVAIKFKWNHLARTTTLGIHLVDVFEASMYEFQIVVRNVTTSLDRVVFKDEHVVVAPQGHARTHTHTPTHTSVGFQVDVPGSVAPLAVRGTQCTHHFNVYALLMDTYPGLEVDDKFVSHHYLYYCIP